MIETISTSCTSPGVRTHALRSVAEVTSPPLLHLESDHERVAMWWGPPPPPGNRFFTTRDSQSGRGDPGHSGPHGTVFLKNSVSYRRCHDEATEHDHAELEELANVASGITWVALSDMTCLRVLESLAFILHPGGFNCQHGTLCGFFSIEH